MRHVKLKMTIIGAALLANFLIAFDAYAGAWTLPQGYFYIEWFNKYYADKKNFNADRKKTSKGNNGKYGEWRS